MKAPTNKKKYGSYEGFCIPPRFLYPPLLPFVTMVDR